MAYIEKVGKNSYRIKYYLDGKKIYKPIPAGTPKYMIQTIKKEIEVKIAWHKAGVKKFYGYYQRSNSLPISAV